MKNKLSILLIMSLAFVNSYSMDSDYEPVTPILEVELDPVEPINNNLVDSDDEPLTLSEQFYQLKQNLRNAFAEQNVALVIECLEDIQDFDRDVRRDHKIKIERDILRFLNSREFQAIENFLHQNQQNQIIQQVQQP